MIEAHHLFGVAYERIDVVVHPQSIVHSLDPPERRRLARPPRLPGHAGADLLRAAPPRARRRRRCQRSTSPTVGELSFEAPDLDDASPACAWPARPARPAGPRPACSTPPTRSRSRRSSTARIPFTGDPRGGRARRSRRCRPAQLGALRGPLRRATPRRARASPTRARSTGTVAPAMSWVLAFAGFAVLVVLHEAGHFAAAKAVGMRVERFFLFFPPKLVVDQARRDRVRDRRDPARRLREDHRHEPGRGAPPGGRAPRLLQPAGLEADRGDRRRARR